MKKIKQLPFLKPKNKKKSLMLRLENQTEAK